MSLALDTRDRGGRVEIRSGEINLKAMKSGDLCFFYHSNDGKEIVGIAKVVKTAYPEGRPKKQEGDGA